MKNLLDVRKDFIKKYNLDSKNLAGFALVAGGSFFPFFGLGSIVPPNFWIQVLEWNTGITLRSFFVIAPFFLIPIWLLIVKKEVLSKKINLILAIFGNILFFYNWLFLWTVHSAMLPAMGGLLMPVGFLLTLWESYKHYKSN